MNFLQNGDTVKITWLPNPINNPHVKSCYIGAIGIVYDLDNNGGFDLKMETAWLSMSGRYKYEIIKKSKINGKK